MKQVQQSKYVLGCDGVLTVVASSAKQAENLLHALWQTIDEFEDRFSRFLPDSELTAFNHAAGQKTPVSPEFLALLQSMKHWSAVTNDLYNPFILPALQRAGYIGSWPTPSAITPATYYADGATAQGSRITFGTDWARIPAHTAIDTGGIGKGYLLDMLAAQADKKADGFWFSLGGDIISSGTDIHGKPWKIGVQKADAPAPAGFFAAASSGTMAVATSGTTKRNGVANGKAWHHIIDPRTNKPAKTDVLTATICHEQGTAADVLAKCLVIIGSQAATDFCHQHKIQALLQLQYKTVHIAPERIGHNDARFEPAG